MANGSPYNSARTATLNLRKNLKCRPRPCTHPGCTEMRQDAPNALRCKEHASKKWNAWRARETPRQSRKYRPMAVIRRDLAEQFATFLNRFDLMVKRDKTLDPLR